MIHRACVRKLRERNDRGDDRHPERRPATPHRGSYSGPSKDKAPRHSRSKSFSRPGDAGDVSAFLVNFLANRGVKATKVLKDADLDPHDVHNGFAMRALLAPAEAYMPDAIHTVATVPTAAPTLKRHLHLPMIKFRFFLYMFIVGSVQGLFS